MDYEADDVTVVEDKPITFGAEYPLPDIFWLKLIHATVARSLCDNEVVCPSKQMDIPLKTIPVLPAWLACR